MTGSGSHPIIRSRSLFLVLTFGALLILLVIHSLSSTASTTPHEPIDIRGDDDFTLANGVTSGSGTLNDPFVIDDHLIEISTGIGVGISNTSQHFTLGNITINGDASEDSTGVRLDNVKWAKLDGIMVTNVGIGIALHKTAYCTIANNSISALSVGIDSAIGVLNIFINNTIWVDGTGDFREAGIILSSDIGTIIENSKIEGNCPNGISIYSGRGQRLLNTSVKGTTDTGIVFIPRWLDWDLYELGQVFINRCAITNTSVGIDLFSCKALVENTTFRNLSSFGILGERCGNIQITKNRFEAVQTSISLKRCGTPWIEHNVIAGSMSSGISIESSSPHIRDNTISDCAFGIKINDASGSEISTSYLSDNLISIMVEQSNDVTISSCEIVGSVTQVGIQVVEGEDCTIEHNIINGSARGIVLTLVFNTEVIRNFIAWCDYEAISVNSGSNNNLHHNNLIRNNYDEISGTFSGPQAIDDATVDQWDDGNEGNHWSDFQTRYPSASIVDGVWDTPYGIAGRGGFKDRYPLAYRLDLFPPIANAGSDKIINQNTTVTLDGSSSSDDVAIITYLWSFVYNDLAINLTGNIVNFIFDHPGKYTVMLKVTDGEGRSSSDDVIINVIDTQPPVANAGEDIYVEMGEGFTLDGSPSWDNVGLVSYAWTLDPDGQDVIIIGLNVTHSFDDPGSYIALLNVSDPSGNWAIDTCTVHVLDLIPPVANAGDDITVDQGTVVHLDGSNSTDNVAVINWTWSILDLDEDILLIGENTSFEFLEPGIFNVILEVSDGDGNLDRDALVVTVRDTIPPIAKAGMDLVVDQGLDVILDGRDSTDNVGIVDHRWMCQGTGVRFDLSGAFAVVTFHEAGEYQGTLNVTDGAGNWAIDDVLITVIDTTPPVADAGEDVVTDQGDNLTLDGTGSWDNVQVVNYIWMFTMDEMPITLTGGTPSFTFEEAGVYRITLMVKDARGNTGTDSLTVTVLDTEPPVPSFSLATEIFSGIPIILDGTTSWDNSGIMRSEWTVVGPESEDRLIGSIVSFTFNTSGSFIVGLKLTDRGGNAANSSVEIVVHPLEVRWRLGPFKEYDEPALNEVSVRVVLNGTAFSAMTDEDGWIEFPVNRFDLITPATVSARKEGFKPLDFTLELGENGEVVDDIPPMVRDTQYSTGNWQYALVLVIIAISIILGLFVWTSLRRQR